MRRQRPAYPLQSIPQARIPVILLTALVFLVSYDVDVALAGNWKWKPWPNGKVVVKKLIGIDAVTKSPIMFIKSDKTNKKILCESEDVEFSTFNSTAVSTNKVERFNNPNGVQCKLITFRIHSGSAQIKFTLKAGTGGFNADVEVGGIGTNQRTIEIYEFCADGTAAVHEALGPPPSPSPPLIPDPVSTVSSFAQALVSQSACPVSFIGASPRGTVSSPATAIEEIISTSATTMGLDFVCDGVITLAEAQIAGLIDNADIETYRSFLATVVNQGDQLVEVNWMRGDGLSFKTIAVTDSTGTDLKWDSMILSWHVPGPDPGTISAPEFIGTTCDANGDSRVDRNDISAIFAARNSSAAVDDPRDVDCNRRITVNDARICTLECTEPRCALSPPP